MYKKISDFEKKVIELIKEYSDELPSESMGNILIYKGTIEILRSRENKISSVNSVLSSVIFGISLSEYY